MPKQPSSSKNIAALRDRREKQAAEGVLAMAEYRANERAVRDRTAKLRAARLVASKA